VTALHLAAALVLLLSILLGLLRVLRGPTAADRMLAAQLFGTTGVAVLLLLGRAFEAPAFWDVALVFAVLAAITGIAFARRGAAPGAGPGEEGADADR
jgi:multicomponent Na+:H+ antiporter subunit F